jgi:hypothetical protein
MFICFYQLKGTGGSMSEVVGLPNNSYKPITNTAWVRARLCKLQKGCIRIAVASDKVYQLLAHERWFSSGIPASSTTKTGRHDIAEIFLKVTLNTIKNILIAMRGNIDTCTISFKMYIQNESELRIPSVSVHSFSLICEIRVIRKLPNMVMRKKSGSFCFGSVDCAIVQPFLD